MSVTPVLLGLGSNCNRHANLCAALDALAQRLDDFSCSPVFESEAVGYNGENFYNLVVKGQTQLNLAELNAWLKALEDQHGRTRRNKEVINLDIDILTFGAQVGIEQGVELPRAEILKNAFVLWPLALLVPEALHPVLQRSYQSLWQEASIKQQLWPVAFSWGEQALTPAALLAAG